MAAVNGGIVDSIVHVPYDGTVSLMLASLERNLLPDAVVRRLTRVLLARRLRSGYRPSADIQLSDLLHFAHCTLLNCVTILLYLVFDGIILWEHIACF